MQRVDLGPAGAIEPHVQAVLHAIASAEDGEIKSDADAPVREALASVSTRLFEPLLAHAGSERHLVLSPDGLLWLLPWSALLTNEGQYLVQQYDLRYVVSGRDLIAPSRTSPSSSPLIVADPQFDLTAAAARTAAAAVLGEPSASDVGPSFQGSSRLNRATPLPGTAMEAEWVRPSIQKYCQAEPTVYAGRYALEEIVKAFRSPRAILLATHGFFLPASADEHATTGAIAAGSEGSTQDPWQANPLLRCGVLNAGVEAGQVQVVFEDRRLAAQAGV